MCSVFSEMNINEKDVLYAHRVNIGVAGREIFGQFPSKAAYNCLHK